MYMTKGSLSCHSLGMPFSIFLFCFEAGSIPALELSRQAGLAGKQARNIRVSTSRTMGLQTHLSLSSFSQEFRGLNSGPYVQGRHVTDSHLPSYTDVLCDLKQVTLVTIKHKSSTSEVVGTGLGDVNS